MKKYLTSFVCAMSVAMVSTPAFAGDELSVSVSADLVTDYVFRGVSLADTAIQTGVEASTGGFTAGAWFSTGVGDTSVSAGDEIDLYVGYDFGLTETIDASVGVTYYHYPQGGGLFETKNGSAGTYEVYGGLSFDLPLSPSVTAYYDFTLENLTLEGSVEHSVEMGPKTSLDLGATVGAVSVDSGTDYQYGQLSAAVSYGFTDDVSAYVGANFAFSSEDTLDYKKGLAGSPKDSLFFVGAGISAGF